MSQMETPKQLLRRIGLEVEEMNAVVRDRFSELTEDQLNWQPTPKSWGVGHCLEHLILVNGKVVDVLGPAIERATILTPGQADAPYRSTWLGRKSAELAGPDSKTKVKAPSLFKPQAARVPGTVVSSFLEVQDRMSSLLERADGKDLQTIKVSSPALAILRFRIGDYLNFVLKHAQRHINQAVAVLEKPGFPAA